MAFLLVCRSGCLRIGSLHWEKVVTAFLAVIRGKNGLQTQLFISCAITMPL